MSGQPRKGARRIRRVALWLAGGLAAVVLLASGAAWLLLQASLPKLDGTLHVAGLKAPVEVARDRYAVPHIAAQDLLDAVFAQGFVHAQDRLFQMEFQRRTGAGRLAEILGEQMVPLDGFLRTLGLYRSAAASVAALAPATRAWLEAYAAGVNAFLDEHARPLPPEFLLLRHFDVEPWQPADSLVVIKLMALTLDTNLWDEVRRAELEARLPPRQVAALWPGEPAGSPVTLAGQITERAAGPGGSNVWVVDGSRSASGRPLLANDPHLGLQAPGTFYLARLATPARTLVGASLPGVPGIVIGRNRHLAWGFTTPGIDSQDLFLERLAPGRPGHYQTPDGSRPFGVREEVIEVRGSAPVPIQIRSTRHGPVVSDVRPEIAAIAPTGVAALAWTALTDQDTTLEALYHATLAEDRAGFVEALRGVVAPSQNVAFADAEGIGFFTPGRVPIRQGGRGARPAPGWQDSHDWTGWIPFDELPHALDPAAGVFINANNRLVGRSYPHFLTASWPPAYRARRIEELIAAARRHDLESFAGMQRDVVSNLARDLLPFLDPVQLSQGDVGEALQTLRLFDGTMAAEASEPLLFAAWYRRLSSALLGEAGEAFWRGRPRFVVQQLRDCQDCSDVLADALARALTDLEAQHGGDPAAWRWGEAHAALMPHPVLRHVPLLGPWFAIEVPTGGDGATVDVGHFELTPGAPFTSTHAASFRGLYDLADLTRSRFVTPTGQSGHLLSPHRSDLTQLWAAGRSIEINAEAVADPAARAGTLWLRPRENSDRAR